VVRLYHTFLNSDMKHEFFFWNVIITFGTFIRRAILGYLADIFKSIITTHQINSQTLMHDLKIFFSRKKSRLDKKSI
jgi:hypothetical protein